MVALGLDQRLLLPRWINELGFLGSSPRGARGSAYIVLPNEYGPSDQTNINRTVFLNPLGRWSMIRCNIPDVTVTKIWIMASSALHSIVVEHTLMHQLKMSLIWLNVLRELKCVYLVY